MNAILDSLGLSDVNAGTWLGAESVADAGGSLIESVNPASGQIVASVRSTTTAEYDRVVTAARESFSEWRKVPAPERGNAVRLIGNALRDNVEALGSLVTPGGS